MRCSECDSKFTFTDRYKSMFKTDGRIKCSNCKNTFRKEKDRFIIAIPLISIFFADTTAKLSVNIVNSKNLSLFIGGFIGLIVGLILFLISQNWCKYIMVNK